MAYSYQNRDEPIYALATPLAESALAVIRTAGQGVVERIASCFSRPGALKEAPGHTAVVGAINDPDDGSHVDQVVCVVYRAPKSYSGDEAVELSCHGSVATITACMRVLERAGLRQAEPGEFTLRAFLAGKMGLTQAEAVHEIVKARTDTARRLALGRLEGRLEARIEEIKQQLVGVLAAVQIQLDYPEEDTGEIAFRSASLDAAVAELGKLVETYGAGRLYQGGVRVALAGATNAGKSSLFNRLLAEDRSIVSETHGTTRDFIEASIEISGIPVQLFDTAGIREIQESVEREGIRRTREVIGQAAAVIYLVDATVGVTPDDRAAMEAVSRDGKLIPVWNKVDLLSAGSQSPGDAEPTVGTGSPGPGRSDSSESTAGSKAVAASPAAFIPLSAERGEGLDALRARLHKVLTAGSAGLSGSETVIDNERQAGLVRRAIEAGGRTLESMHAGMPADIVAVDLQEAVDALGEITGEVSSDDVLDAMFSGFCVGK